MDKKSFSGKGKGSKPGRRGIKNAGFLALVILFALIMFAAYGQKGGPEPISETQAIQEVNKGQYAKLERKGNEVLLYTKKDDKKPAAKTYVDPNASLKESGFNTSK